MDFERKPEISLGLVFGQENDTEAEDTSPKDAAETDQSVPSPRRRRRPPILDDDGFPDPELRGCDYIRPARGFDGRPVDLG